jgi:hypothetical protein
VALAALRLAGQPKAAVPTLLGSRMKANRVYLKYLTSKTKPIKTKALFAPSRLRDREASFTVPGSIPEPFTLAPGSDHVR